MCDLHLAQAVDDGAEVELRDAAVQHLVEEARQLRRNRRRVDAASNRQSCQWLAGDPLMPMGLISIFESTKARWTKRKTQEVGP